MYKVIFNTLLTYYYFFYLGRIEVKMQNRILDKIVNFFQVAGVIIIPVYWCVLLVKELASIPWAEWAANGTLEYIKNLAQTIILMPFCLFIMWILHAFTMFGFHKLWPDEYDERGHRRKYKIN